MLPLLKKRSEIVDLCHKLIADLKRDMMAVYDDTAAIGKLLPSPGRDRHAVVRDGRRQFPRRRAVTVRERNAMAQERVPVEGVKRVILDRLAAARP